MRRIISAVVLAIAAGGAMVAPPVRAEIPQVDHIVIIVQENRSPDNLFHGLPKLLPGADIANDGKSLHHQVIALAATPLVGQFDLEHTHAAFLSMYRHGRMDGAARIGCNARGGSKCPPNPPFSYVNPSDVSPYFFIAENYGFANRMFQSNQGPSFPAHQFLFGGTSQISANSALFADNNPKKLKISNGCDAPPTKVVGTVGPGGSTGKTFPCFNRATMADLLDKPPPHARQGLTWRYYAPSPGSIWTAPEAIRNLCVPKGSPPVCTGRDWTNGDMVFDPAQVLRDVGSNSLRSVSWVMPTGAESDHPVLNDGSGPSWVASVVNAIGQSAYWNNTVILILWDDWGGWYDHVAPPIDPNHSYYENGFRVPLLVVSAYTPQGYVSQTTHTFGSVLKFIETAYGLPLIPPRTYVDSTADDLSDFFDFTQPPRPFVTVPAPLGPEFFLNDTRPRTPPDDD